MLARATAAAAGVPLIYASGSDFVEMFVGRGAARVTRTCPPWGIRPRATDLGRGRGLCHVESLTNNNYARKKAWLSL